MDRPVRPVRLVPFRGLVIFNTLVIFLLLLIIEALFEDAATRLAAAPILTIAFASGSASALYATRGRDAPTPRWEHWLIVLVAVAIWLGVALSDFLGPRHADDALVTGASLLVVSIGWDVIRDAVRRARRRR